MLYGCFLTASKRFKFSPPLLKLLSGLLFKRKSKLASLYSDVSTANIFTTPSLATNLTSSFTSSFLPSSRRPKSRKDVQRTLPAKHAQQLQLSQGILSFIPLS
uniref:Uncharacterized protein n=1 Tax=Opuntia streptacantha TaxID=393608 RepID=A0A7C9FM36_OPUST